jgi:hypothetical protein
MEMDDMTRPIWLGVVLGFLAGCGDKDGDGGSGSTPAGPADSDGDGFSHEEDCNDSEPAINPDATEVCDGVDNDCSGAIDDGVLSVFYADGDGDGYGDPAISVEACEAPAGFVTDDTDCTDSSDYNCDGLSDDADDSIDASTQTGWYGDGDGDGYGDAAGAATLQCEAPSGTVADHTDCDDTSADVNPAAAEVCDEADVDEDCSGAADDADPGVTDPTTWNIDVDGDGYGSASYTQSSCERPSGYVADDTDCDDGDATVNPGATEVCDDADVDEDCSGAADDADAGVDATTYATFYLDADGDFYGDSNLAYAGCETPAGYTLIGGDCADDDGTRFPYAYEDMTDGVDNDCDGAVDADDTDPVTDLPLCDDDTEAYVASGAWSFPLCGSDWTGFSVNSNGQITFDFSHTDLSPSVAEFLSDGVAIAMNWDDLRPNGGSTTVVVEHDDAVAVHFRDVPDCYTSGSNTFTVVMLDSGLMHFSSIDVYADREMVGWSCGDDSTVTESDLSVEIADRPTGAVGLEAAGARAHYEFMCSDWDLLGQSWMMCGTAGTDSDGDGWSDLCGDLDDGDASVYPGSSDETGGGCDSGDTGCEDTGGGDSGVVPS